MITNDEDLNCGHHVQRRIMISVDSMQHVRDCYCDQELIIDNSVKRQAQHQPDRISKPRTGLVGTDRLDRTGA